MPHLQVMQWNFNDELHAVAKQKRTDGGTPETTYYTYDSTGQRVRKVTELTAAPGAVPVLKNERIYAGGTEVYREYQSGQVDLERKILHVMDDEQRIALIETRTKGNDGSHAVLTRYQFGNHLGSVSLETDDNAQVISYEEYHPYGTTAYQAMDKDIKAAAKQYRYTGMERDEETGFTYHGVRYYAPWLGRWVSCDPIKVAGGLNLFVYSSGNPLKFVDLDGNRPDLPFSEKNKYGERQVHQKISFGTPGNWGPGPMTSKKIIPSGKGASEGLSDTELYRLAVFRYMKPGTFLLEKNRYIDERLLAAEQQVKHFFSNPPVPYLNPREPKQLAMINTLYMIQLNALFGLPSRISTNQAISNFKNTHSFLKNYRLTDLIPLGGALRGIFRAAMRRIPFKIALGISKHKGRDLLRPFARRFCASTSDDWAKLGLHNAPPKRFDIAFKQTVNTVAKGGGRIKFNLDKLRIQEALAGDPTERVGRYTAWELQQIVRNKKWLKITDFYLGGNKLSRSQLTKLGIKLVNQ
jgi:RHS repeat-associated protein